MAFAVLLYYTCLPDAEAYITHFVTSSHHKILEIAHTHIHKRMVLLSDSPVSFT